MPGEKVPGLPTHAAVRASLAAGCARCSELIVLLERALCCQYQRKRQSTGAASDGALPDTLDQSACTASVLCHPRLAGCDLQSIRACLTRERASTVRPVGAARRHAAVNNCRRAQALEVGQKHLARAPCGQQSTVEKRRGQAATALPACTPPPSLCTKKSHGGAANVARVCWQRKPASLGKHTAPGTSAGVPHPRSGFENAPLCAQGAAVTPALSALAWFACGMLCAGVLALVMVQSPQGGAAAGSGAPLLPAPPPWRPEAAAWCMMHHQPLRMPRTPGCIGVLAAARGGSHDAPLTTNLCGVHKRGPS